MKYEKSKLVKLNHEETRYKILTQMMNHKTCKLVPKFTSRCTKFRPNFLWTEMSLGRSQVYTATR